ncbi:MAG: type III-B CRISPR module RAMP protein Cmr4 [Microcoleus sp. CSU_2_2]|nr:type III-B CRISPR module RAMP protein Cmr4 [Microcoleus sp. SU_5_3]NJS11186.1 type III-B CRISPR module RAMP protein Cmr4 [Microcoleus sp. CSU_2_2]
MATYKRQRYLFMTLDPVHIGTGGYRLGRVDNSIVREPGTKIPKIPGTSLHGAARSYAAQLYETPEAAGQSHDKIDKPDENPVCYTFGYIKKSKNENDNDKATIYSGVVNIFDAHIVLFPVHSMAGPVWVSTVERLEDADFTVENLPNDWNNIDTAVLNWQRSDALNLGWLMLQVSGQQATITAPDEWKDDKRWQAIEKIVLVKDALFSQVVNSNLEVRTSVAINPDTGAAEEGALFTYEAIPRAAFLTAEVVLDDYRQAFPNVTKKLQTGDSWHNSLNVVKSGFKLIEWLGVGGMGTRGFGRMAIVGEPSEEKLNEEKKHE